MKTVHVAIKDPVIIIAIKDPVNLTENITNKSRTPAVYKIFCELLTIPSPILIRFEKFLCLEH